jgi:hypothetical protein
MRICFYAIPEWFASDGKVEGIAIPQTEKDEIVLEQIPVECIFCVPTKATDIHRHRAIVGPFLAWVRMYEWFSVLSPKVFHWKPLKGEITGRLNPICLIDASQALKILTHFIQFC